MSWSHGEAKKHTLIERLQERCVYYSGLTCVDKGWLVENWCERCLAVAELERLQSLVDKLLPVAQMYVDAFKEDELMTFVERLYLQRIEDILADPEHWDPNAPIGGA